MCAKMRVTFPAYERVDNWKLLAFSPVDDENGCQSRKHLLPDPNFWSTMSARKALTDVCTSELILNSKKKKRENTYDWCSANQSSGSLTPANIGDAGVDWELALICFHSTVMLFKMLVHRKPVVLFSGRGVSQECVQKRSTFCSLLNSVMSAFMWIIRKIRLAVTTFIMFWLRGLKCLFCKKSSCLLDRAGVKEKSTL